MVDFETGRLYLHNTFIATEFFHVLGVYAQQPATLRLLKDQLRHQTPAFWDIPVSDDGLRMLSDHLQHYSGKDRPVAWLQLYDYSEGPWREIFPRLNFHRDAMGRQQNLLLVIAGPPELLTLFEERAHDLHSIAYHTTFEDPQPQRAARGTLRWLHLSDFHFRAEEYWQQRLPLKALENKLRELVEKGQKPHLVCITGDIAYTGAAAEYEQATKFFQKVSEILGVDQKRFFVVPGNHDVDRNAIKKLHNWLLNPVEDAGTLDELMSDATMMQAIVARQRNFIDFTARLLGGARGWSLEQPWRADKIEAAGWQVGVMQLNKVWAGGLDSDKGRLYFGERQLLDQLALVQDCDLVFALCHHPLSYLADFDEQRTRDLLAGQVQFLLRGHLHRNDARALGAADTLEFAAGAILEHDPHYVGFMLGELEPSGDGRLHLFRYSSTGQGFWAADTLFSQAAPEGRWSFKFKPRNQMSGPETSPSREAQWAQRYRQAVLGYYGSLHFIGLARTGQRSDGPLDKLFVPLLLKEDAIGSNQELTTEALALQLNGASTVSAVALGDPGSGKTTLCQYLAHQLASDPEGKLPFLLPFRLYTQLGQDFSLLEFLRGHLAKEFVLDLELDVIKRWLSDGRAVLLLDGMDEVSDPLQRVTMRDRILAFRQVFPRTSLFITSRVAGYDEAGLKAPFRHWRLAPFSDLDQEQFAVRWYAAQSLPADQDAAERATLLIADLKAFASARELARNPMLATLLALVHATQARLPRQRAELFRVCVETLLITWPARRGSQFAGCASQDLRRWLERIAWWFQTARAGVKIQDFLISGPDRGIMVKRAALLAYLEGKIAGDAGLQEIGRAHV